MTMPRNKTGANPPTTTNKPRILLLDTELSPSLGMAWGKYNQTVNHFERDWHFLSVAWQWYGEEKKVSCCCLPDFPLYKTDKHNDRELVAKVLFPLFDAADVVVAHNIRFDVRKATARIIFHELHPSSPYKTICTLKLARKVAAFTSNKLDDLGEHLKLGRKVKHEGMDLWKGVLAGDVKCWRKMRAYNIGDVVLLRQVYERLRGFEPNPINLNIWSQQHACPRCQSTKVEPHGWCYLRSGRKLQMRCNDCGGCFAIGKVCA